jgi:hypothetical protein
MTSREGLLVDFGGGVLRKDVVLVQDAPGALLYLGFGARAVQLARFALDDNGRERDDVQREADEILPSLPLSLTSIGDRGLRRLAVAEAAAKAGYDPGQPRDEDGRWTADGVGSDHVNREDGADKSGFESAAAQTDDTRAKKDRFVDAHLADAQSGR